ncbi:hypothetical protein [Ammoniphilus sp. YIM 78166]|uniref:hypothetical protein n=1 Tax=Ammoniphilus sp. YIM 78166 TaxID=1644106 RepID=UPI0010701424|nr:hypothetical protein [Ammoniphilus sp. YIM 78166]
MPLGTAVLYKEDQNIVILRGVEKELVEEIKSQCGNEHCICQLSGEKVDYGSVKHVLWMDRVDIGD